MRESAGVGGRFHAEVLERKRRQFGDAPRRRVYANGEQGDLRVGGGEGAVAAPAQVAAPGEIGELDTVSGRDEQLSSVRVAERRPGASRPAICAWIPIGGVLYVVQVHGQHK